LTQGGGQEQLATTHSSQTPSRMSSDTFEFPPKSVTAKPASVFGIMDRLSAKPQEPADLAHAYAGGVSTPAVWQFGCGNAERASTCRRGGLIAPISARELVVSVGRDLSAAASRTIVRRCLNMLKLRIVSSFAPVELRVNYSPSEVMGSTRRRKRRKKKATGTGQGFVSGALHAPNGNGTIPVDPREKRAQNKATVEMHNVLSDRRNTMVIRGLTAGRITRRVKPKPTSALASRSIRPDERPVAIGGARRSMRAHESGALGQAAWSKRLQRQ
jgi:hypothetical protein